MAAVDPTVTMEPRFAIRSGSANSHRWWAAVRLTAIPWSQPVPATPALWTRMSSGPAASTARRQSFGVADVTDHEVRGNRLQRSLATAHHGHHGSLLDHAAGNGGTDSGSATSDQRALAREPHQWASVRGEGVSFSIAL